MAISRSTVIAYGLLVFTALCWAGAIITGRMVAGSVPPLSVNFWRWAVGFVLIAPFGLPGLLRSWPVVRAHWRVLVFLGFANMTAFGSLLFVGLEMTQAINGALLQGSMSITIVAMSFALLGVRINPAQGFGIACALLGVVTIVSRGDAGALLALQLNVGDVVIWVGVLFYSLYSVYLPRAPKNLSLVEIMTALCFVGATLSLPLYLWEALAQGRPTPLDATALWSVGYLAVFPSVLAQIFWALAIGRIGVNTASYFIYLSPVFGTLLGVGLLHEIFAWYHLAGIVFIFAGIYLGTKRGPAAHVPEVRR
jgi:drug/metabolite transporter (DMT)-like permease